MNGKLGWLVLITFLASAQMGQAQWSASEKGTLLGAVAGGGAGAAIGKKSGNPITGAVVGTLGGAILGNVIGDRVDQRRAETYYQPQYQTQYQPIQQQVYRNPGVTIDQVIHLTRSGVGDDLIISHVQQNGFQQSLTTNDLILLKNQGVSDRVIMALQRPTTYAAPPVYASPPVRYSPPVTVVEEVHVVPAPYYYARPAAPYGYYYR
ncbi:MAG: glycine zipper 2TM domain-containing protein [Planctomycetaceae bacterium]|nr:glycine zipper 2TM domain-containing protein [Planctomycetaceae bacterium]